MHFCVRVADKVYDPNIEALVHYCRVNPDDFEFEEKDVAPPDDEQIMMKNYYQKFKSTQDSSYYFKYAPKTLLNIKRNIHRRMARIL